jgi:hypothetical protein
LSRPSTPSEAVRWGPGPNDLTAPWRGLTLELHHAVVRALPKLIMATGRQRQKYSITDLHVMAKRYASLLDPPVHVPGIRTFQNAFATGSPAPESILAILCGLAVDPARAHELELEREALGRYPAKVTESGSLVRLLANPSHAACEGSLTNPKSGEIVGSEIEVTGTLGPIPVGKHVWIAHADRRGLLWPKDFEVTPDGDGTFGRIVYEGGRLRQVFVVLLMTTADGHAYFTRWIAEGSATNHYPGIVPSKDAYVELDRVEVRHFPSGVL